MNLLNVTFFLTDRCSATCPVCCFQCSPKNRFIMDEATIRRYIDEAAALGTVRRISYSGGECMLYPELLGKMAKYAKENYGLLSYTVSNGFWAADYEKGKALMKELKDCGLSRLRLSADDYHQQFVSVKTLKNALRILLELDMSDGISVMDTKSRSSIRHVIEELRPEIYAVQSLTFYPLHLPSAALANPSLKLTRDDLETPIPCNESYCVDYGGVELFTDGYMYNCCSQFSFEMPRMRVGKIGDTTLKEAEKKINADPVLDLLRRESVSWFAEKAKELGYPVKEKYSMSCEMCRDLLCNEELMQKLEPLAAEEVQKRRFEKFKSLL